MTDDRMPAPDTTRGPAPRLLLAAVLGAAAFVLSAAAASAQEPSPTPIVLQPVPRPVTDSGLLLWFTVATLAFALIALGLLLWYMDRVQARFYAVIEALGRAGRTVRVTSTAPFATQAAREEGLAGLGDAQPAHLPVSGPGVVVVGTASDPFTATLPAGTPAASVTWTVTPAAAAAIQPVPASSGAQVTVIAAVVGAFTLKAETTTPTAASGDVQVSAVAAQAGSVDLPFIGRGFGSIMIVIILVAAVIILGLAGVLSGDAVAPIIAALLGYIFGMSANAVAPSGGRGGAASGQE